MEQRKCIRCDVKLDLGKVQVGQVLSAFEWMPATAKKLSLKFTKRYPVATYRCPQCGTLEAVASEPND